MENAIIRLYKENHTIGVIAERISSFDLDEWKALILTVKTLVAIGETFTYKQIQTAIRRCFDPRYYTRNDLKDLYSIVGIKQNSLPRVPSKWKGITEWKDQANKYQRLSSKDYSKNDYEFYKSRDD